MTAVTDAEGRRIELAYDALGNLTAITYPDGTQDTYEYDALGRLVKETPRTGLAASYSYDSVGNVLSITSGKKTTSYACASRTNTYAANPTSAIFNNIITR